MSYQPTKKEEEIIKRVYDDFSLMRNLRNNRWQHFNDRSLKDFIDDSQLRLNGYVPSRASQGKENWQSNVFHPVTKNKLKAILASVALDVPQIRITAQNDKHYKDQTRAEIMKNLVNFSYNQDNKEEQLFFEAWECGEKGTVIVYDGFLKANAKKKIISSYDPETGDIEYEEEDVETDNQCVNFIVPLMNMYIKDWNIFDIQKQPSICWVERMDVDSFDKEFGKHKKAKEVPTAIPLADANENDLFFREYWQERTTDEEPIEVIRYFNKGKDEFIILANGVVIHESPLLLGKKKKWYPFAKTVLEPFATDFFYGNSLPNSLMGEQDIINSLFNMALDRSFKSMSANLIIGNANKDDFDLEDQNTSIDTRIYVQDIQQIKEIPVQGVSESDFKMIDMISRGLDLSSVDQNQQGIQGRGVTAREVVIANENAKKLKGILYMFLTALWIQKIKLRIMNILTYYTQPKVKKVLGEFGEENTIDEYQSFLVENADLSPEVDPMGQINERKGSMGIQMVGSMTDQPTPDDLDVEEMAMEKSSGEPVEILSITSDYLDDWIYDIKVESESIYQKESGLTQLKLEEKLRVLGAYFPQLIQMNTEKLAKDTIIAYEDDPDEYELMPPPMQIDPMTGQPIQTDPTTGQPMQAQPGQEAKATATAGQEGMKPLPKMT